MEMPDSDASEQPVAWMVDDIEVSASLTRPEGAGPFPAIVMVAGSGPTDRNWNSPLLPGTNGSAALLAKLLAANGFIVLRYDKRASGPAGRENATRMFGKITMQSHVDELAGGVRLLAERPDVDIKQLFSLTNSEGCIHALNYQAQTQAAHFAGLILTSAPAQPVGALARAQIVPQLQAAPGGDALLATYDRAIVDFMAGRPVEIESDLPEGLRNLLLGVTYPGNQPFARELWSTDPVALLANITAPVLIVLGKKDIQVDWQVDGALFEAAAKARSNITIAYADDANHVLKYEPKDRALITPGDAMVSYSADATDLDPQVVKTMLAWLKTQLDC